MQKDRSGRLKKTLSGGWGISLVRDSIFCGTQFDASLDRPAWSGLRHPAEKSFSKNSLTFCFYPHPATMMMNVSRALNLLVCLLLGVISQVVGAVSRTIRACALAFPP